TTLPLTDIHRHLDGNIRPQTILELGRQYNISLPAKTLGRVLSVFHNRRWDSDFLTLKGLLAEGVLGE
ncbi:hypothetical protein ACSLO9_33100, partial [Escherichia coli]